MGSVVNTGNMGTQTKHFLILVLLAFCPITLQGLKCWFGVTVNTSGDGGTSNSSAATGTGNFNINDFFNKTLKECDNTTTKACTIIIIKVLIGIIVYDLDVELNILICAVAF